MHEAADRRLVALVCTLFMVMLGTVYSWSFFQKPLCDTFHWSNSQVAWAFSLAICFLGLAAAGGGVLLRRFGPSCLALWGGLLLGGGYLLAAAALHLHSLVLLYLGYGLIGGTGLGLGYVTPVATVARWFPDRKGLATGMVVMGFGFGAILMSKLLAPLLLTLSDGNLVVVFAALGLLFMVLTLLLAGRIINPPEGWAPRVHPPAADSAQAAAKCFASTADAIFSRQFLLMWGIFFCNIIAGIAIIGFQSPLFQEVIRASDPHLSPGTLAGHGATLIAVSSLFNGIGRFFWGGLSDRIGRKATFCLLLGSQLAAFLLLISVKTPWLFALLVCYILLCYGGGFGTVPAFVLDTFGSRLMPAVYGAILTAWSAAGVGGPQLVAMVKDRYPEGLYPGRASTISFSLGAVFLAAGLLLSLFVANGGSTSASKRNPQRS
jgi:OFA family oxalate/formate antiporter-like MFS transporter